MRAVVVRDKKGLPTADGLRLRCGRKAAAAPLGIAFIALFAATLQVCAQTNCVAVPEGVVGWWRAEGDGSDLIGTNNAILTNGASFAAGIAGQAFSFSGLNQYAVVPDSPDPDPTNGLTIEAWVYPIVPPDEPLTIVSKDDGATNRQYLLNLVSLPEGQPVFRAHVGAEGGFAALTSAEPVPLSQWTHVAMVYDGSQLQLYVNGAFDTSMSVAGPLVASSEPLLLGGSEAGFPFEGLMDEITVYRRGLSAAEIQAIYSAGPAGKCSQPVPPMIFLQPTNQTVFVGSGALFTVAAGGIPPLTYQWRLDGTNLPGASQDYLDLTNVQFSQAGTYDVEVRNSSGSVTSSVAILTVNPAPPCVPIPAGLVSWWAANGNASDSFGTNAGTLMGGAGFARGIAASAFSFTGTQYVQVPDSPSLNPPRGLTIEGWVLIHGYNAPMTVVAKDDGGGAREYLLNVVGSATGQPVFRAHVGLPNGFQYIDGTQNIPTNTWTHVAMSYDGAGLNLYVNGSLDASIAAQGVITPNSLPLTIGATGPGSFPFVGLLDELSLYRRGLTGEEIRAIYDSGVSEKCSAPSTPYIFVQPTNQSVFINGSVKLAVVAGGTPPLIYQWSFNGANVPGAAQSSLSLTNLQSVQSGTYAVRITNPLGFVLSTNVSVTVNPLPNCLTPPDGMVSFWAADGNALDSSGVNHGTLTGQTGYGPGFIGQAFLLDGTGSGVDLGNATNLQLQDFTIEGWVKRSSPANVSLSGPLGFIFSYGNGGYGLAMGNDGGLVLTQVGVSSVGSPGIVTDTNFHHIVVTKAGAAVNFYVDGQRYAVGAYSPTFTFTTPAAIGTIGGGASGDGFLGSIDELSVYSRALSAEEVRVLYSLGAIGKCSAQTKPFFVQQPTDQTTYLGRSASFSVVAGGSRALSYQWNWNDAPIAGATRSSLVLTNVQAVQAGTYSVQVSNEVGSVTSSNATLSILSLPACAPPSANLISWWRAEDDALDQTGGNDGQLIGNARFAPGLVDEAFVFDGSSSGVVVGNPGNLQVQNFTIEAWIKRSSASSISLSGGLGFIFGYGGGGYGLAVAGDGSLMLTRVGVDGVNTAANLVTDTNYHHVAVTKSGSAVNFYVDGSRYSVGAYDPGFTFTTPAALGSISDSGPDVFLGAIDELAIYGRALSSDEINAVRLAGAAGKCVGSGAPYIFLQPTNQSAFEGGTVTFRAGAAGARPLAYQWTFNGDTIADATQTSLVLSNLQSSQAGTYALTVSNLYGTIATSNSVLTVHPIPACVSAPVGLVSWWRAEGDATDLFGGNRGTLTGNTTFGSGEVGQGFVFDGSGSGVVVGNPANLQLQNFTIEAWARRASATASSGSGDLGFIFGYGSGGYGLAMAGDGSLVLTEVGVNSVASAGLIRDISFHHVAVTKNGTAVSFYVDGVQYPAADYDVQFTFTTPAGIGTISSTGPGGFLGSLDELSIYSRALSSPEIALIYAVGPGGKCANNTQPFLFVQPTNQSAYVGGTVFFAGIVGGSPPLSYQWTFKGDNIPGATNTSLSLSNLQSTDAGIYALTVSNALGQIVSSNATLTVNPLPSCLTAPAGLVSWWPADGDASDQVGNNSATITGATTFGPGYVGQGFVFDGSASGVVLGPQTNLQLQDFTIEAWIQRSSTSNSSRSGDLGFIFGYGFRGYGLALAADGSLMLTKVGIDNVVTSALITDTSFHHVVVTKTGPTVIFYVDAQPHPANSYDPGFEFTTAAAIGSISDTGSDSFWGTIDEPGIYSRALSPDEVRTQYTLGYLGKCRVIVPVPPFISLSPTNRYNTVGDTVPMRVGAGGTPPLYYQWLFNGTNLVGATDSTLIFTNVQRSQAGAYSVLVTNNYGSVTSGVGILTINPGPALISLGNTNAAAGTVVSLPVTMDANGVENLLSFSLWFNAVYLTYTNASLGSGAAGAGLLVDSSRASSGYLGLAMAFPAGQTFAVGPALIAQVSFLANAPSNSTDINVGFGDGPIVRQLLDSQGNVVPANYSDGSISISVSGFEGDLSPRPSGDLFFSVVDWVLAGQFAANLDGPKSSSEFQRADCAPRGTLGDGAITVSDWVQTGRYVLGLDPLASPGGPSSPVTYTGPGISSVRTLKVDATH